MHYREVDLTRVRTVPVGNRPAKVDTSLLASVPGADRSFHTFLESLPDVLAARNLRLLVAALAHAKKQERGVLFLIGGHVAKVGLGPLVVEWLRRGIVTHVALNGAAAIHDFELAAFGQTSEDVESGLADGSFGMAEETGAAMNQAASEAARGDLGLGEGLADALSRRGALPGAEASILLGARQAGVPITVHVALGSDVIHQHPTADGAALGATSHRDFKRLAASLSTLDDGGVVINLGSAVMLPEVFLKALSVARNLDQGRPTGFVAADFDMQRHYRPRVNVVERPTRPAGIGIQITGHHEIMFPLLTWAVFDGLDPT
ncbi:MAG TPA: hypothetical protein VLB12_12845 [Gemmatimonadales bacterium]|nr:hypothetical protein [Gemmatimonadales bacterium]